MPVAVSDALRVLGLMVLAGLLGHEVVWAFKHGGCKPAHCECSRLHKFLAGTPGPWPRGNGRDVLAGGEQGPDAGQDSGPVAEAPGLEARLIRTGPFLAVGALMVNLLLAGAVLLVLAPFVAAAVSVRARRRLRRAGNWTLKRLRGGAVVGAVAAPGPGADDGDAPRHDHGHVGVLGGVWRYMEPGLPGHGAGRRGGQLGSPEGLQGNIEREGPCPGSVAVPDRAWRSPSAGRPRMLTNRSW